ncbi:MAG: hypothetical protein HFH35_12305 [Eubacterium sp.]|nr:hypothetical protein [Eubacterium sp.]
MAKTMDLIEMDFQNAVKAADELEQIAKNLHTLADSRFQSCLSGIAANWKGENAAAFCKKGSIVGDHILDSASDLRNAAQTLREMARNLYEAEKKNYEIAKNREI